MFEISRAVVLAAGKGTRMGSMTQDIPKPMLSIHGRPMLELILERLQTLGISHFLIVTGYHGEVIEKHFEKTNSDAPHIARKSQIALRFEFVRQNPVNGTGSGALLARDFAGKEPFLLTYGDILCDPSEYKRCIQSLGTTDDTVAAVAVKWVDDPSQGAAVYEVDGRVKRIVEKPPQGTSATHWNSAGFYTFHPVLFDYLARLRPSPRGEYELTSALSDMLEDGLDLRISPVQGEWRDVGRPEDLAAMNR
jgi:NDP-sugar pyrophosphorylase family protein